MCGVLSNRACVCVFIDLSHTHECADQSSKICALDSIDCSISASGMMRNFCAWAYVEFCQNVRKCVCASLCCLDFTAIINDASAAAKQLQTNGIVSEAN